MHDAPNFATALGNARAAPRWAKTQFPGQTRSRRAIDEFRRWQARCASNAILAKLERRLVVPKRGPFTVPGYLQTNAIASTSQAGHLRAHELCPVLCVSALY